VGDRDLTLDDPVVELGPGDRVLMIGKPGIGKSVFFRAVAGLWPWGRGKLGLPPRNTTMFLPQHAYLPTGTLRHALTYPLDQKQFLDSDLIEALDRTGLAHLVPLLDDKVRWEKTLSNNVQLHLALAQLLVHRPQWVISDEGLSHLNEEDRALVFSLFQNELERSALLTITSDDAQPGFYTWVVHLVSRPIARGDKEPLSGNTVPSSTR
jgi:putative ATP-binding cassette transporter